MAINPSDSRLPRYREGNALPVYRKQSMSQAVSLYLTNRDVWSNLAEVHKRKEETGSEISELPECGAPPLPNAAPDYEPTHHGIIEGVVHVNPWLLDIGSYVFVEVDARYRYARSELDPFDCEVNEVVFRKRVQLNPPPNYTKDAARALKNPPKELSSYSRRTRQLYAKLGGPVSGQSMKDEALTSSGVLVGTAMNTRRNNTFIPQTMATKTSGYPDHPFVTYNFPFRFDINGAPDSLYLKNTPRPTSDNRSPPPSRMHLFYNAVFGFAHHESDTDPDSPSELEDSDTDDKPRIRHPGDPLPVRDKKPDTEKKKRQWEKDLFHPDCYPWRPRQKRAPRNGISWAITAYAVRTSSAAPSSDHIARLRIRKLSYVPRLISIEHLDPPKSHTDYCLAVGPRAGFDAGAITLLAKLDRILYAPGEPIQCSIKFHNSSVRLIHRLIVEVHQCIRVKACVSRVWRSLICRRCLNDTSLQTGMPVLPGTENSCVRVTLNPWPTIESIREHFKCPRGPIRPSGIDKMEEAWALRLPKIPGQEFALQQPGRHEVVPPHHVQRRSLAMSSFSGVLEYLLSFNEPIGVLKPLGEAKPPNDIWQGNPHIMCRCVHRKREPGESRRIDHMPPKEPYQVPITSKDVYPEDSEVSEIRAKRNALQPYCRKCMSELLLSQYPIHVSYEVVVLAELLPQHQHNPLRAESAIRNCGLSSGLLIDPSGDIIGPDGPRITLPCFLAYKEPFPEERVPLANYHIDQRQDCKDHVVVPPKIHEPSLGKGFFTSNTYPIAPCNTGATNGSNENEVTEQLTRPHRPDYLQSHDVILTPDGAKTSRTGTRLFYSNLPPIHANSQTLASINSGSSYDSVGKLSDSVSPVPVGSERTNCAHTTQLPDAVGKGCSVEPTVPYTIVANMINALSQRIMNQISEDELERRLRLWEERAAAVYSLPNVVDARKTVRLRKSGVVEPIVSSNGVRGRIRDHSGNLLPGSLDISAVDSGLGHIKTSDLKHSLLAQARRLEHRKKLDICTDLLDHLVSHTNYPAFEADLLKLLGRQPNWHQISVLYYLSRCAVRHLLTAHFHKLDSLNQTVTDLSMTGKSALDSQPSTGSSVTVDVIESARLTALTEMGVCRANIERIKDFTVTFFLRWYADWVYKRGGWQSVIEDTEDSELD
ncbi:Arrestin [Paragonimus heterotremus]|uniref:Arrestin n=1 Tax=Paragonimus heterotremus TaxID=100268 RepID=A0A8J4WJ04_9TREM|nr:Arrestin [Paragonimus heterotremus]